MIQVNAKVFKSDKIIMNKKQAKKEIKNLRKAIEDANYRYYVLSNPDISDKEYDNLVKRLKELEEKYPELQSKDSPTQRVSGGLLEGFNTVRHKTLMLSLDNTYSIEEINRWEDKIKRLMKKNADIDYVAELKIDGLSAALTYKRGTLTLGATRGDGQTGEDVTANIRTIKTIPLRLAGSQVPELIEIRGEVFISKKDFLKLNKFREKNNENLFANPRNAASGSLKMLDPSQTAKRNLRFIAHSLGHTEGDLFVTQEKFLNKLKSWHIPISPNTKYCNNIKEVIDYCKYWQDKREELEYEVDGVVIKVNSRKLAEGLGSTLKSPRWAVAYKFPAHRVTTKVVNVEYGVGRTGIITPVAILEPVECGGVVISRATLHNFDEIERLGLNKGDKVLIERAGEVIPKIIKVLKKPLKPQNKPITPPKTCPVCSKKVVQDKSSGVYWYCVNPDCPAQLKRSLIHFASRKALDIEGMGESVVNDLVDKKLVKSISDTYLLEKEDLLSLPLFKERKAANLIMGIKKSKNRPFSAFLYGLGIRHVGEKAAATLSRLFKDIDRFFELEANDLQAIAEIGPIMAESIVDFFSSKKTKELIENFKKIGLNLSYKDKPLKSQVLSGKTFVLTGELRSMSRSQAQGKIQDFGGKCSSSVSKNIDFVIVGKNPGSKYDKAKKIGLKTLNETQFLSLFKAA